MMESACIRLVGPNELTAFYYNDAVNSGVPWGARWTPQTNLWNYTFYDIQETGVTMDRPLPMPSSLSEYFPAVFRGEMLYQNHVNFPDMGVNNWDGHAYSDVVKWMAAIDVDQAYAPWLTSTGNLSANFEVFDKSSWITARPSPSAMRSIPGRPRMMCRSSPALGPRGYGRMSRRLSPGFTR